MFVIRADRLIDGTGSLALDGGAVLVEDDRIVGVGTTETLGLPDDCPVLDFSGCTLLPGLIDAHVHLTFSGDPHDLWEMSYLKDSTGVLALKGVYYGQKDLMAGFTTVRDMGARSYSNIAVRDGIEMGLVPGPRVVACGLPICASGGHFDSFGIADGNLIKDQAAVVDSPDAARAAVRQQFKMGADFVKTAIDGRLPSSFHPRSTRWQQLSKAELVAICEAAHEAGRKVAAHTAGGPGMWEAIQAGIDSLEHLQGFSEEEMDLVAAHDLILVPTLTATKCSVDAGLNPRVPPHLRERSIVWMNKNWQDKQDGMVRALKAGVRIALGTDAGYSNCLHGKNAYELELLVGCGMTPMQAIVAATATAAECVGMDKHVGRLEAGLLADLLIVQGNPLADISVLRDPGNIKALYKGGEKIG